MADKSWMLNPKAIRHANSCIQIIRDCEGIRLKLSQPDFLSQLHAYVDKIDSRELGDTYANLLGMAGVGNVMQQLKNPAKMVVAQAVGDNYAQTSEETVSYGEKQFPRYRNGREFKGLVGGVPRYR